MAPQTPEQRKESARKGAETRKANKAPQNNLSWLPWIIAGILALILFAVWNPFHVATPVVAWTNPSPTQPTPAPYVDNTPAPADPSIDHGNGNPQPYISHPNFYAETTVSNKEYTWNVVVNEGEIGIVGGFKVNGVSGGVYSAYGPGKYTFKVTDGFVLTIDQKWAKQEWNFRIGQADQYGWAKAHLNPGPIGK